MTTILIFRISFFRSGRNKLVQHLPREYLKKNRGQRSLNTIVDLDKNQGNNHFVDLDSKIINLVVDLTIEVKDQVNDQVNNKGNKNDSRSTKYDSNR